VDDSRTTSQWNYGCAKRTVVPKVRPPHMCRKMQMLALRNDEGGGRTMSTSFVEDSSC
jgi:hypothetical protein